MLALSGRVSLPPAAPVELPDGGVETVPLSAYAAIDAPVVVVLWV